MREIDLFNLNDKLSEPELVCDVACLLYDCTDSKSFEYIARIYLKHFTDCRLPILIVACKSDSITAGSSPVRQNYVLQPDEFCAKYKLSPPQPFTVSDSTRSQGRSGSTTDLVSMVTGSSVTPMSRGEIYSKVATMAAYPTLKRLVHVLLMQPTPNWLQQHIRYALYDDLFNCWLKLIHFSHFHVHQFASYCNASRSRSVASRGRRSGVCRHFRSFPPPIRTLQQCATSTETLIDVIYN